MAGKDDWIDDVRRWCFDDGCVAAPAVYDDLAVLRADTPPAEIAATTVDGPWPSPDDAIGVRAGRDAMAGLAQAAP